MGRIVRGLALVAIVVGGAILLNDALRGELRPPDPVWERPLDGPWDGSPGAPSLVDGSRELLVRARDGELDALGRLDRRLHAVARDHGGEHPLAHVDAWRDLLREVWGRDEVPEPGVHPVSWTPGFTGLGTIRYALLVPGTIRNRPFALVLSLPAPGEDPEEHLRRRWSGAGDDLVVIAPERPEGGVVHPGRLLLPLRHVREQYAIDDDRVLVAGLGRETEAAARLAASFADRFAGLVTGPDPVPRFALRPNLALLPVLRVPDDRPALDAVCRWLATGASGRPIRRNLFPRRIDWRIGPDGTEDRAWWLIIARRRAGEEGRIEAEIRADNRIEVRAHGISGFRVLLNDRLVDLDRPVIVRVNGDRVVSRVPTRSVRRVVDAIEALGDLSAVFPESIDVMLDR